MWINKKKKFIKKKQQQVTDISVHISVHNNDSHLSKNLFTFIQNW